MSWYGLLSILQEAASEDARQRSMRPWACPNDGEPLVQGPDNTLFCRYDGWRYPDDWTAGDAPG